MPLSADAAVAVDTLADGARFTAPGTDITVSLDPEAGWTEESPGLGRADAEMVLHLDRGLSAGCRGFSDCST